MLPTGYRARPMPNSRICVLLALTAPALCQNDFALDKTSSGALGASMQFAVAGAPPFSPLLNLVSQTAGPVPLSLLDPGDPRLLEVGADLLSLATFSFTDGLGAAAQSIAVPNDPAFQGLVLHWQSAQFPGATTTLGQISNDVVTQFGASGTASPLPSGLAAARAFATAFAVNMPTGPKVVVAGGGGGTLTSSTGLASTEMFDARELRSAPGASMTAARALHQAVTLQDGRVLIVGGTDALGGVLSSCEIFDPATGAYTATGAMATPRALHAAVRLADGRVLAAGGTSSLLDATSLLLGISRTAEIYNPATGAWTAAANLGGYRLLPSLSLLPNGRVLTAGGVEVSYLFGIPISAGTTTACQVYNPATNSWAGAASLPGARTGHHYNQVTLDNGRILITGGVSISVNIATQTLTTTPLASAAYYDQPSNTWTAVNMPTARSLHSATRLPDGRVVVCGGAQGTIDLPIPIDNVEVFSPTTNAWTALPPLPRARAAHAAALLSDGTICLLGGQDPVSTTASTALLRF